MKRVASLVAVVCLFGSIGSVEAQKRDTEIKGAGGVALKATYYSPGKPGPAMLLFHQCNMDRHAWDSLADDLVKAGFHVLTFDLRGFGQDSKGVPPPPPPPPPSAAGRAGANPVAVPMSPPLWGSDADAALAHLLAQKDVDMARVAAGGASCGVSLSAELAARNRTIKALVLLSGEAGPAAKAYISSTPSLPVLGATAERDESTAELRSAVAASKNPASTLKMYPGTEHGVAMFSKNPDLKPAIIKWLQTQLRL